jgi:hypothetical protein
MYGYAVAVLDFRNLFTVISSEHAELREDPEATCQRDALRRRFEQAYTAAAPDAAAERLAGGRPAPRARRPEPASPDRERVRFAPECLDVT